MNVRSHAFKTLPLQERFWARVRRTMNCWEWTGAIGSTGYGSIQMAGKTLIASRVSWTLNHGVIPDGIDVLHTCDNRKCVRPDHLFLGTNLDNVLDAVAKGRHVTPQSPYAGITHCKYGHALTPENVWVSKVGGRYCRQCLKRRAQARKIVIREAGK